MELQQREAQSLPSIIVPGAAARFRSRHDDQPYGRSPAMSIPGSDLRQEAPPPLPPPRMPLGNPNDQAMSIDRRDYAQFTPSLSSGYGSAASSVAEERERLKRRVTGIKTEDHDEGYSSYSSWSSMERSRDAFPPLGFGLHHDRFQFQSPAGDVDSMKKKLDQMRPVDRSPPISSLSSLSSLSSRPPERYPSVLSMPHQLPFHPRPLEPSRMSEASSFSPRSTPFSHTGRRSPQESVDMDRSPRTRSSRNNSDDASVHGGYEYYGAEEMEIEETSSLKRLQLGDVCLAGQKRRAPSDDLLRRGEANPRGSPTPRLATISQGVPVPSLSRSSSYVSNISVGPSSAATYDRRSPRGQSPSGISPTSTASPYTTPKSLNPSPRGSISGRATGHHRNVSGASPRKIPRNTEAWAKMQGFFMCECCPKKPKKFETAEDLKAHEAEKQYNCQYCGNRFKNKNEAERHQNSLHVRRHSWSCSALKDYKRAFHESTSRPYEADTCGYCGEDFARSGRGPGGNGPRYVTERDWEERSRHLQDYHKFGECNTSKKFFRADHFRQHLKHSHAGASGKWTNMLETACMIDEEPVQHR
ncbi:unnamed protein product [Clonostachys rosea f. rosea IK726]|uniref:Uncharacterized protein n=1 Tax=Clonostachys rosea f. rosea IK726 TaxID=1349383 RepID=A0ACA9UFS6_BIOOC|nr:unnamed protein product [Clonostachys rosea f. rosea IK726]